MLASSCLGNSIFSTGHLDIHQHMHLPVGRNQENVLTGHKANFSGHGTRGKENLTGFLYRGPTVKFA